MKKHSHEEILLKLGRADELAQAGKSQPEICKTLGVSVMTLHRWRKLPLRKAERKPAGDHGSDQPLLRGPSSMAEMRRVMQDLSAENRRLRKIVTDLLLEKTRIEEVAAAHEKIRVDDIAK